MKANHYKKASVARSALRAAVVLAALMSASSAAQAACCVFNARSIVAAVNASASRISATVTTTSQWSASQITAAIVGAQSAAAANVRESTAITNETIIRAAEQTERSRQESRYRMTDPCSVAATTALYDTGISAATQIAAARSMGRGGSSAHSGAGASGTMRQALEVAAGRQPAPSPEIAAQAAAKGACETFAAGDRNRARLCSDAGFTVGNTTGYESADIRAETLLDGPQGNIPRKRLSIDIEGRDGTAVNALMSNLNTPIMLRDLKPGELNTDEGRRYMALKDSYEARMSLAERPMKRHIARIAQDPSTIPYVETLLQGGDAAYVTNYLNKQVSDWRSRGISADEVLNLEVSRRYMNRDWQLRMAAASPEEVAREALQVASLQNVLLWNISQELRENGVGASPAASSQVRAELVPQLAAQHRAAAR